MSQSSARVGAGGRLVIPSEFREKLGIHPGDAVVLSLESDGLRVMSVAQAVRRAQLIVARYAADDRALADEIVAERRKEGDDGR